MTERKQLCRRSVIWTLSKIYDTFNHTFFRCLHASACSIMLHPEEYHLFWTECHRIIYHSRHSLSFFPFISQFPTEMAMRNVLNFPSTRYETRSLSSHFPRELGGLASMKFGILRNGATERFIRSRFLCESFTYPSRLQRPRGSTSETGRRAFNSIDNELIYLSSWISYGESAWRSRPVCSTVEA